MHRSRLGLKALGLCALVVGLTVFVTGVAQAEKGSNWRVGGVNVPNNTLKPPLEVKELENKTGSLLGTLIGLSTQILCTNATLTGAVLLTEGSVSGGGSIKYTGCKVFIGGTVTPACEPKEGIIKTNPLKGLILLVLTVPNTTVETLVDVEPAEGTEFATITSSEKCAVGEKIVVRGVIDFKDCKKAWGTDAVEHLIEESPEVSKLTANNKPASLDGSVIVQLGGAEVGKTFSAQGSATKP